LLFFDDEGTEDGGLVYGISKDQSGHMTGSNVHLSFDQYIMGDRGDYSILEALQANDRISKLPEERREARVEEVCRCPSRRQHEVSPGPCS
jgi:hypothetical protein